MHTRSISTVLPPTRSRLLSSHVRRRSISSSGGLDAHSLDELCERRDCNEASTCQAVAHSGGAACGGGGRRCSSADGTERVSAGVAQRSLAVRVLLHSLEGASEEHVHGALVLGGDGHGDGELVSRGTRSAAEARSRAARQLAVRAKPGEGERVWSEGERESVLASPDHVGWLEVSDAADESSRGGGGGGEGDDVEWTMQWYGVHGTRATTPPTSAIDKRERGRARRRGSVVLRGVRVRV